MVNLSYILNIGVSKYAQLIPGNSKQHSIVLLLGLKTFFELYYTAEKGKCNSRSLFLIAKTFGLTYFPLQFVLIIRFSGSD